MSAISLKSITGITSITTPAGVDNVFTVHTNDTVERFRIDQSGNLNISGIITATAFHGDGSNLTGITGVTINSNVDNRLVTATGTTGTLNGESNLTFNGSILQVTGQGVFSAAITASTYIQGTSSNGGLKFYSDATTSKGVVLDTNDHLVPTHNSFSDLGLTGTRWRNVYADTFYGDGSNLTGITGVTINNNANNRLVTATGTTGTLDGEATLTFTNSGSAGSLNLKRTTSSNQETIFYYGSGGLEIETRESTPIYLKTNQQPRLFITSAGLIGIGPGTPDQDLHIKKQEQSPYVKVESTHSSSTYTGINLRSPTLNFQIWNQGPGATGYSGSNSVVFWQAAATGPYAFYHGNDERLRITSGGNVRVNSGVIENAKTISSNYTVSNNYNAISAGPMSVASGVSVTVPSGSAWTIV